MDVFRLKFPKLQLLELKDAPVCLDTDIWALGKELMILVVMTFDVARVFWFFLVQI